MVAGLLAACTETLDTHGQVILPSALAKIKPGETTQTEVQQLLGTPSATGTLNESRWYYVSAVVGKKAFNPYDLKSRRVIVVDFDPATSLVTAMTERTEKDGKPLEPASETTKTQGQSMGFIEQMMGNVGIR